MTIDFVQLQPKDKYNRELERNVRPTDWVNPTATGRYNLVVIGAGTAGLLEELVDPGHLGRLQGLQAANGGVEPAVGGCPQRGTRLEVPGNAQLGAELGLGEVHLARQE